MEKIICLECGLEVDKTNPGQKYCGPECKKQHYKRKAKLKAETSNKPIINYPTWTIPPKGYDLKIWEIVNILKMFEINFTQYERKR